MGQVVLTNDVAIEKEAVAKNLKRIINQIYKLLPLREEGKDWKKPLETLMEEIAGMAKLIDGQDELFFLILCKMKGLFSLTNDSEMPLYRRIILELLSLLN
ncbi:MAG: hypothetical protein IKQ33_06770 [Clostridia bacterium]|nr:hypothetical protein [Clostridia bacterium]